MTFHSKRQLGAPIVLRYELDLLLVAIFAGIRLMHMGEYFEEKPNTTAQSVKLTYVSFPAFKSIMNDNHKKEVKEIQCRQVVNRVD